MAKRMIKFRNFLKVFAVVGALVLAILAVIGAILKLFGYTPTDADVSLGIIFGAILVIAMSFVIWKKVGNK